MKRFSFKTATQVCLVTLVAGGFSACQTGPKEVTTESGMKYMMIESKEGRKAQKDDIVSFVATIRNSKDSVLFQTPAEAGPTPYRLSDNPGTPRLEEGMKLCAAGDSINFTVPASEIYGPTPPPGAGTDTELKVSLRIVSIQTLEEFEAARKAEQDKLMQEEQGKLEQYIANSGKAFQKTESGLYYLITEEGTGKNPEAGNAVTVHYRGTLLDGTPFDASYDRNEPFDFELGRGMVIRGWDEGIALLKKGGKAVLVIPSSLAYGEQQRGPVIKPYSTLMFEVELLDFK